MSSLFPPNYQPTPHDFSFLPDNHHIAITPPGNNIPTLREILMQTLAFVYNEASNEYEQLQVIKTLPFHDIPEFINRYAGLVYVTTKIHGLESIDDTLSTLEEKLEVKVDDFELPIEHVFRYGENNEVVDAWYESVDGDFLDDYVSHNLNELNDKINEENNMKIKELRDKYTTIQVQLIRNCKHKRKQPPGDSDNSLDSSSSPSSPSSN